MRSGEIGMNDLGQGIVVCTFLRARNEGGPAGSRMEEKHVCVIAVMGDIGGKGRQVERKKKEWLRVNDRRTRESGTERSRSKFEK